MPRLATATEWLNFAEPGYVKAAMSFSVASAESGTRLETETCIHATDRHRAAALRATGA